MRMLAVPAEVSNDAASVELLRAWIDGGRISASLAPSFGTKYESALETTWAMILSDVAHHLVDAIILETRQTKDVVRATLVEALRGVRASKRGTAVGSLRSATLQRELPIEIRSPTSGCVELVRVFQRSEGITMVLFVGVWLKQGKEEQNWANILYDLAAMIASTLLEREPQKNRDAIVADLLGFIDKPTTTYSGYYEEGTQPAS